MFLQGNDVGTQYKTDYTSTHPSKKKLTSNQNLYLDKVEKWKHAFEEKTWFDEYEL